MSTPLANPFKGLAPYDRGDTLFGRDADLTLVTDRIFRGKTTLLFAGSGVGKTSFFRAKFIPEIEERYTDQLEVRYHSDWSGEDPLQALKSKLGAEGSEGLSQFFDRTSQTKESSWIVILDQFEELFTHHVYRPNFGPFRDELCEAINKTDTSVRFAFSIREEFLGELSVFDNRVPDLFANYYRLRNPDQGRAKQIIRLTAEAAGAKVDDAGLDALIGDLSRVEVGAGRAQGSEEVQRDYVIPPHLQLVCRGLWDSEAQSQPSQNGDFRFLSRYATQERTGIQNPARHILQQFCVEQMNALTLEQQSLAAEAFDFLVTSQGAKMSYELKSLARHMSADEGALKAALERLSSPSTRILRESQWQEEQWFALYHDMYAPIVYEWKEEFEKKQQSERLLEERAKSCDRRAIEAEARGNPDRALMLWLMGLEVRDTKPRRLQAGRLVRDATALERTFRHDGPITAVCLGTKCRRIVTASTARRIAARPGPETEATTASDDDSAAEEFSLIQVWDVASGAPVGKPIEINEIVRNLALSNNDNLIAALTDGSVCLLDVTKGKLIRQAKVRFPMGPNRPTAVRFDETGKMVLCELRGAWWIWRVANFKKVRKSPKFLRLVFSPDGTKVAASTAYRITVQDAWTQVKLGRAIPVVASALSLSSNGEQLLTGLRDGSVQAWNTRTGEAIGAAISGEGTVRRVAFATRDTAWAELEQEMPGKRKRFQIFQWDIRGKALADPWTIASPSRLFWPRFSPAAQHLWGSSGEPIIWKLKSREVMDAVWTREPRVKVSWTTDDQYFLAASRTGVARLWKSDQLRPSLPAFAEGKKSVFAVLSGDGSKVATISEDGEALLWNSGGTFLRALPAGPTPIKSIAFGPGQLFGTLATDGTVTVWDLSRDVQLTAAKYRNVQALTFAPNGRTVVLTSYNGSRLWEFVDSRKPLKRLAGDQVSFSANGRVLVECSTFDEEFFAWDAINSRKIDRCLHGGGINGVILSNDGKVALSAGDDGIAKLWSLKDREVLQELTHQGPVTGAAFNKSGRYVATLSDDLFLRVWRVRDGDEIGRFRYERTAESVVFSPDDSSLVIAAARAIHLCNFDPDVGLSPVATRQLGGSWTGNYSFLDRAGKRLLVLTQTAFQSWRAEEVQFDQIVGEPIQGEVSSLKDNWSIRTGLRYEGEDVVPLSVVRPARTTRKRREEAER